VVLAVEAEAACKLKPGNNKTSGLGSDGGPPEITTASYWPVQLQSSAARHLVISRRKIGLLNFQPGGEG